ncbi:MAG: hypothetical protein RR150_01855 [Clostridia bacterium]
MEIAERRKLFRAVYGERLLPEGFFWKKDRFYRIGDQIVLQIGARMKWGDCSLRWGILPFFREFGIEVLKDDAGPEEIEYLIAHDSIQALREYNQTMADPMADKIRLDTGYQVFFRDLFDHFNAVHDAETYFEYIKWRYGGADPILYSADYLAWGYISLREYEEAAIRLRKYLEETQSKPYANRPDTKAYIERRQQLLDLIESHDYDTIDRMLLERVEKSTAACREFFGKKFI